MHNLYTVVTCINFKMGGDDTQELLQELRKFNHTALNVYSPLL